MNEENKRLRIAYLTFHNAQDKRAWSGLAYYMAQTLQNYCGDVSYIGPIDASRAKLPGKVFNKISTFFLKKTYFYNHSFAVAKRYAKVATEKLAGQSFDVIVAADGQMEVAFLETDIPIILVGGATYGLLHNYYPWYSNLLDRSFYEMNSIQKLAVKKASKFVYSSKWAARSAIEDYAVDPRNVYVIPHGANFENPPSKERALGRTKSGQCRLLFLGVEWQRKGGDIAFETLLKLEEMGITAELIVCGCIPPKSFSHKMMKVIPFLDKNDEKQSKELEQLFLTSDFLLVPTRNECFGIVFCEANAFGLPVITSNTGGVPEVVKNGENGFVLPLSARGDAYAELIASLYRDDERYAELVRASRRAFDDRLNWDAWGVAFKQVLTDL